MIRIAIVNDVRMAAEVLRRVIVALPDAEVAWIAEDGQQALEKCRTDTPDIVLMDLIMPVMDGVEATRQIMQQCPCSILVVTATVDGNCSKVFDSLGHGALDAVNTPILGREGDIVGAQELIRKIRNVAGLRSGSTSGFEVTAPTRDDRRQQASSKILPLLAIGSSTGGPQALATVLSKLPRPLDYSVAIVQHLDQRFVPGLTEWLTRETNLSVRPIEQGQEPVKGMVAVASTQDHLVLSSTGYYQYVREPALHAYRPSVDVFFNSLLKSHAHPGVAVLLTGMGRDGAAGMKALRDAGWKTIAQDEESSIVWGMPGAAVRLNAADQVLPLEEISGMIAEMMMSRKE